MMQKKRTRATGRMKNINGGTTPMPILGTLFATITSG